jgi:Amt family ammonium transporter
MQGLNTGDTAWVLASAALVMIMTPAYTAIVTFLILKIVMLLVPLRVTEREETLGLDVTQHAEAAYV